MAGKTSTKKNYLYTIVNEIVAVVVPLVLVPYSSRVLGADGIGQYAYVHSIVYYFMIASMMGLNNYGVREIAKCQSSDKKRKMFCEIYSLQIISCMVLTIGFCLIAFLTGGNNKLVFFAQLPFLLSCFFDVAWFFSGIERFRIITICNSLAKIASLVMVLLLVKTPDDLLAYCFIMSIGVLLGNIILWIISRKALFWKISQLRPVYAAKHFKSCLILFIPIIAMKIYKVMDKTAIGVLSNMEEVGYYSNADSIINVPMGIVIALGVVMLPRLTSLLSTSSHEKAKELFKTSLEFGVFIITPIMFGLIVLGPSIAPLFLGDEFIRTGTLMQIIAITMIFMTVANIIRTQILIPKKMDKEFSISVIVGAIINLIGNAILIPIMKAEGACISTILAEFLVMAFSIYYARKDIEFTFLFRKIGVAVITSVVMASIVYLLRISLDMNWSNLILQIIVGMMIYLLLNCKYVFSIFKEVCIGEHSKKEK